MQLALHLLLDDFDEMRVDLLRGDRLDVEDGERASDIGRDLEDEPVVLVPQQERQHDPFVALMDESVGVVGKDQVGRAFQKARNHHQVLEMSGPPDRPHAFPRIVGSDGLQPLETGRQQRHGVHLGNAPGIIQPVPVIHPQINL